MIKPLATPLIIEPRHEISNNVVCATSKASDQPAHVRSLIRAFASRIVNLLTKHPLELLSLKKGCIGTFESTFVKISHCLEITCHGSIMYFRVLQSSILELYRLLNPFYAFYLFNGLLLVLQILHIIWTYMIIRIAWLKLAHNKVRIIGRKSS